MKFLSLKNIGILFLWLTHTSAFIGINLGYEDFFLPLSVYNLWFIFIVLVGFYPIRTQAQILLFLSIAVVGFFAEVLGVASGKIFGEYAYGENLGFKIADVPIIIGINWAILSFVCTSLANYVVTKSIYLKTILASGFMILFDIFIEHSAPTFDFWEFELSPVPLQNYISWFILALIFNYAVLKMNFKSDTKVCFHIYTVQVLFFMLFYVF